MKRDNNDDFEQAILEAATCLAQDQDLRREAEEALAYIIFVDDMEQQVKMAA